MAARPGTGDPGGPAAAEAGTAPASYRTDLDRLVRLAAPLVTAQLASMSLWLIDMAMLGRVGVHALDAASLGRTWIWGTLILAMGLLLGLDPLAAQAYGAGDRRTLAASARWATGAVALVTPPVALAWLVTEPLLVAADLDPGLAAEAHRYVVAQLPGLPLFLAYIVARHWLQAQGVMRPVMWIALAALPFNALADWVLIFGHWGFPALGAAGAGAATAMTFGFLLGATAWTVLAVDRGGWGPVGRDLFDLRGIGRVLRLGAPVGVQIGLEFWVFSLSTLWAGWLGEVPLAAHTIVIACSALTFTVPLGISFAAVTRVGNLIGAGDGPGAQRAAWTALGLGAATMAAFAVVLVVGRTALPKIFTLDPGVVAAAAAVFPIAAAFQLSDGLQVVGGGILRGMGRTLPAALFNLLGYYLLALPLGGYLAFRAGHGLAGIWWGLLVGLTAVALMLLAWVARRGPRYEVERRA